MLELHFWECFFPVLSYDKIDMRKNVLLHLLDFGGGENLWVYMGVG